MAPSWQFWSNKSTLKMKSNINRLLSYTQWLISWLSKIIWGPSRLLRTPPDPSETLRNPQDNSNLF